MSPEKIMFPDHLSASAITGYLDCGLAYKFSKVDKVPPESTPDNLLYGTAIHSVLAQFYEALANEHHLNAKDLQELFTAHWTEVAKEREDIQYRPGKDFETLLLEGKELLATFHNARPAEGSRVLGIEKRFSFNLDGLPVPIIGFHDLVLEDPSGVITIVDHKTSARAYGPNEIDKNFQLTVYQMAAKALGYGDREILLRFDCLIKTMKPKFEQYYTTRSELDEARARRKVLAVWEGISKGVFIPNDDSWKCGGCSYQNSCRQWFTEGRAA